MERGSGGGDFEPSFSRLFRWLLQKRDAGKPHATSDGRVHSIGGGYFTINGHFEESEGVTRRHWRRRSWSRGVGRLGELTPEAIGSFVKC
ncbi:hypothetical protein MRB53_035887 [Persea americana]|uniref:Uncharacterized protein n=1 Tax=Persea americana TaxID=3435 RepID=A0ACC2K602_PERAE|nr:hypothetical protein MRB53_035887 [Persea americana]